jgi:catechol 2,3-dioxygenase
MGHVALRTPDLAGTAEHAIQTLGLHETLGDAGARFLSSNAKHHELELLAGEEAGVDHVGFELETADDLAEIRERVAAAGVEVVEPEHQVAAEGTFRFVVPGGIAFELYGGMEREPLTIDRVAPRFARRLGHVTMASADAPATVAFLRDVLGFRLSDHVPGLSWWLRCDEDHHAIAIMPGGTTRLHHYAFELDSFATMGKYADHVASTGQHFIWGPGRHGPGFNLFTYLFDPNGVVVETYADMLKVIDDAAYEMVDWAQHPRAANLWDHGRVPDGWLELGVPSLLATHAAR